MVGREIVFGDYQQHGRRARRRSHEGPMLSLRGVCSRDGAWQPGARQECRSRPPCRRDSRRRRRRGQRPARTQRNSHGSRAILLPAKFVSRGKDYSAEQSAAAFAGFGIAHIPEDRLRSGLASSLSVTENAVLREYQTPPIARGLVIPAAGSDRAGAKAIAACGELSSVPDFWNAGRQPFRREPAAARCAARDAHRAQAAWWPPIPVAGSMSAPSTPCSATSSSSATPAWRWCSGLRGARGAAHPLRPAGRPLSKAGSWATSRSPGLTWRRRPSDGWAGPCGTEGQVA